VIIDYIFFSIFLTYCTYKQAVILLSCEGPWWTHQWELRLILRIAYGLGVLPRFPGRDRSWNLWWRHRPDLACAFLDQLILHLLYPRTQICCLILRLNVRADAFVFTVMKINFLPLRKFTNSCFFLSIERLFAIYTECLCSLSKKKYTVCYVFVSWLFFHKLNCYKGIFCSFLTLLYYIQRCFIFHEQNYLKE